MRTIIYARFSSTLQNARSADDQVALCRERCASEGWEIVAAYKDEAVSGAAGTGEAARPGLNAALARIEAGEADQLLAESVDRVSRHQGDDFAIRERLSYADARLFTLMEGEVDDVRGTLHGLFAAKFRKDLASRIKRGQRGAVADGRLPAGLAYGYRKVTDQTDQRGNQIRGLRKIDEDQAAIVRRVFAEYAAGESPRAIASRLNAEGVPAPRGRTWRQTTIGGDRARKNGMLRNRLYAGVIVHDRTSKPLHPGTRKTLIKPRAESEWLTRDAPELRIVAQDLWERVQARLAAGEGVRPEQQRRPKHLLSGLGVCGQCGGGWTRTGNGYWGCGRHKDGAGCSNNRVIKGEVMERRVLAGLQEQMLHPDVVEAYVREYHETYARRQKEWRNSRASLERRSADADARITRLVRAIEQGADVDEVRSALAAARADKATTAAMIEEMDALPVIPLHPTVVRGYREQIDALASAIAGEPEARQEAMPRLRALIERLVFTPRKEGRGVDIEIEGRLAALIALATGGTFRENTITMERVKGIEPSS